MFGYFTTLYRIFRQWRFDRRVEARVRLAVVGSVGVGKTYLLQDIVGSLEKLGLEVVDIYRDQSLHRQTKDIVRVGNGVEKTPVYACRQENHYVSHYKSQFGKVVKVEFIDVPGEVMTEESINMFTAVMRSMMACKNKIFAYTEYKNHESGKMVRIVEMVGKTERGWSNAIRLKEGSSMSDTMESYVPTSNRIAYYVRLGYKACRRSHSLTGEQLFDRFLEFDTDSALNAIGDAWMLLEVDKSLSRPSRDLFRQSLKNHFYFHYFTFKSTDIVVCDQCCLPLSAGDNVTDANSFSSMMSALATLTGYSDLSHKNWYLVFKGIDGVMAQKGFKEVYELSDADANLVYSHFTLLFRQACAHGLLRQNAPGTYQPPTDYVELPQWLSMEERLAEVASRAGGRLHATEQGEETTLQLLDTLFDQQQQLDWPEVLSTVFNDTGKYTVPGGALLDEYVESHIDAFLLADSRIEKSSASDTATCDMLCGLPRRVYFSATPIDNRFNFCSHLKGDSTSFVGNARQYNLRAHFGALQLTTNILFMHGIYDIKDEYNHAGKILNYLYGTEI